MRYIRVIFAMLMVPSLCISQTSPNTPTQLPAVTLPASPNTPTIAQPVPPPTTIQPTTSHSDETIRVERDAYKQVVEAHQKTLDTIKWAIGIIGPLILVLVGYVVFKNNKEYKDALEQAKEARNDAKEASKKAEEWEENARVAFEKIDERVENKLKEIDERVKIEIEQIKKEGNKSLMDILTERQISELWKTALKLDKEGEYDEATKKYAEIEVLQKGSAAYMLARLNALWGKKDKCREWLLKGQEARMLPTRDEAMRESDLDSVRNEQWFKEIKWKGE